MTILNLKNKETETQRKQSYETDLSNHKSLVYNPNGQS